MALRRRRARASRADRVDSRSERVPAHDSASSARDARPAAHRSPAERLSAVCDCRELVDTTFRCMERAPASEVRP
jgi:hypothetical protein